RLLLQQVPQKVLSSSKAVDRTVFSFMQNRPLLQRDENLPFNFTNVRSSDEISIHLGKTPS
ncbi:MAG: hypothetical protein AAGG44_17900, partial [Planctomycetota bacterium]